MNIENMSVKDDVSVNKIINNECENVIYSNKITENVKDKIILDLQILSNIKKDDKLRINGEQIEIDQPRILQGVIRKLYGEGRNETVKKLEVIVDNVLTYTNLLLDDEAKKNKYILLNDNQNNNNFTDNVSIIFQDLTIHLTKTITGLQNLKLTYISDVSITSRIDLLISKIQNRINKIRSIMKISIN
jgi:hypothetical protein